MGERAVIVFHHHANTERHDFDVFDPDVVVNTGGAVVHFRNSVARIDGQSQAVKAGRGELVEDGVGIDHTWAQSWP